MGLLIAVIVLLLLLILVAYFFYRKKAVAWRLNPRFWFRAEFTPALSCEKIIE